ncbi:MAG: hypothetical protein A2Y33_14890 [Spirochaetes bacterium GWF1_51_8]|nr:MAG: hypothetical protein A2Y33_14890 [Spirochaetes bacterium GWF1_51_8]
MLKNWLKPIEINGIAIPNNLWFAPLAGYSHMALRMTAKKFGAGLAYTEMVSVEGIVRGDRKTIRMAVPEDGRTVLQLFGTPDPARYREAARIMMDDFGYRIIDINFGCPVKKVMKVGAGCIMLRDPGLMGEIVAAVKETGAVVSAKIRAGYSYHNFEETIPIVDKAGADIIILHARLGTQMFAGHADWDLIRQARALTDKILIANGDIDTPERADECMTATGADGLMIGRAAIGRPYLFAQTIDYCRNGTYTTPGLDEIKSGMVEFARLFEKHSGAKNLVPIRSALLCAIRGVGNCREIRGRVSSIGTVADLENALADWKINEEMHYEAPHR